MNSQSQQETDCPLKFDSSLDVEWLTNTKLSIRFRMNSNYNTERVTDIANHFQNHTDRFGAGLPHTQLHFSPEFCH